MAAADPVHVLHAIAPAAYGGLESVVARLTAGLAERGHRVQVAASLAPDDPVPDFLEALGARGVEVSLLRVGRRAYRAEARRLAALCAGRGAPLVHTHGQRSDWVGGVVARRLGLPHLATVHGFIRSGLKSRITEWLQLRSLARFDAVLAVSAPQCDRLQAAGVPAARLHRLPNAWSPGAAPLPRGEARRRLGLDAEATVVGFVGRLGREKAPDLLLEAVARLENGRVQVCLVGDGDEQEALARQAERLGLAERVRVVGARSEAEALFAAFDVFALPSRTEGTPIALFEALAARVPVVAARVGGVPDVVGDAEAWLVPPEDPEALARGLAAALADPAAAAERAARGRQRLEAEFAVGPWLDRHEALYRALLADAAGSGSSASAASLTVAGATSVSRDTPST